MGGKGKPKAGEFPNRNGRREVKKLVLPVPNPYICGLFSEKRAPFPGISSPPDRQQMVSAAQKVYQNERSADPHFSGAPSKSGAHGGTCLFGFGPGQTMPFIHKPSSVSS
jgi:hypothetical protein